MLDSTKKLFETHFTGCANCNDVECEGNKEALNEMLKLVDTHFIEREVVREEIEKIKTEIRTKEGSDPKDWTLAGNVVYAYLSDLKQSLNI